MDGYGYDGGMGGYGYMQNNPAMWTPQQRAQMYAMQLMQGSNSQPQRSVWGAMNNAFSPMMGGALNAWAQNQGGGGYGQQGQGYGY